MSRRRKKMIFVSFKGNLPLEPFSCLDQLLSILIDDFKHIDININKSADFIG